jgi:voltage-gated potassium channel
MDPQSEPSWMGPRADALASRLEPYMLGAALLTVPVIVLEEIAIREVGRDTALVLNWAIWLAFTAELVAMLVVVEDRWRYLRTHPLEVAIVVLTPPFLPAIFGALRTLRLVRVVRLLPLVRAVLSARRLLSLEGLRFVGLITLSLVLLAGLAFSRLETAADGSDLSTWDGIWWAITTVTTVGYGDLSPQSATGRSLAIVVMIVGIGFVAMLTAAAADYFVRAGVATAEADPANAADMRGRLDEMNDRLQRMEVALGTAAAGAEDPAAELTRDR